MQHTAKSFVIHLASKEQVVEFLANGITFRSHPVKLVEVKSTTNITLERVPYGLPEYAVLAKLRQYGECKGSKVVKHKGYGLSKLIVEMVLKKDIPSRIAVQGNPINVFYRNQPRSCFVCAGVGHEAKSCPKKRARKRDVVPHGEQVANQRTSDGVVTATLSFPEVVDGVVAPPPPTPVVPSSSPIVPPDPLIPPPPPIVPSSAAVGEPVPVLSIHDGGQMDVSQDGAIVEPSQTNPSETMNVAETSQVEPPADLLSGASLANVTKDLSAADGTSLVPPVVDAPLSPVLEPSELHEASPSMDMAEVADPLAALFEPTPPSTLLPRPAFPDSALSEASPMPPSSIELQSSPSLFSSSLPTSEDPSDSFPPISIVAGRKINRQSSICKTADKGKPYRLTSKPMLAVTRTKCHPRPPPTSGQKRSQSLPSIPLANQFAVLPINDDGDSTY